MSKSPDNTGSADSPSDRMGRNVDASEGFRTRLRQFLEERNIPQRTVAKALGITPAAVHKALTRNYLSPESMLKLAECYGANLHWLMTGQGEMYGQPAQWGGVIQGQDERPSTIPLLPSLDALPPLTEDRDPMESAHLAVGKNMVPSPGHVFATKVPDDSLSPVLQQGWIVGLDASPKTLDRPERLLGKLVVAVTPPWASEENEIGARKIRWLEKRCGIWHLVAPHGSSGKEEVTPCGTLPPQIVAKVIWWMGRQS